MLLKTADIYIKFFLIISTLGMLKNSTGSNTMSHDMANYHEQDKYFLALIDTMPKNLSLALAQYNLSGMNLSMNSLLLNSSDEHHYLSSRADSSLTPDVSRKNRSTLTTTNDVKSNNWTDSLKPKSNTIKNNNAAAAAFRKIRLYVLGMIAMIVLYFNFNSTLKFFR